MYFVWVEGHCGGLNLPDNCILDSPVQERVEVEGAVPLTDTSFDAGGHPLGVRWVYWEDLDLEVVVERCSGCVHVITPFGVYIIHSCHLS